ncbi:MAG TPA: RNA polymerase subunit sigma-70 [Solirubrobacteraceae bacterium]|jgi:RNA polymerase sigma-70 factor (ECF subfamily)|nr:RNA polymerase subunit sigma-70 [Solirubrobacteraceae bacterium]
MSNGQLDRARAGDAQAFQGLVEPYRRELHVHCYRMLGSLQDAEDAVQEALVSAWRGLGSFEQRASLRAWLYSIATHRCLNLLRDAARRPQTIPGLPFEVPEPTRRAEPLWLEPYPDAWLEQLPDRSAGPDARYEMREAVGLAFVTALQRLPARQRVVLVLRDVLGFRAGEVAEMLDLSQATVTSALQRARAGLEARMPPVRERAPAPGSVMERELADRFADAFERGDIEDLIALLSEDAWVTMPPEPFEYQGHDAIAEFLRHAPFAASGGRQTILVATRANGQLAFAHYFCDPGAAAAHATAILVLTLAGRRISALSRFGGADLVEAFGLPASRRAPAR